MTTRRTRRAAMLCVVVGLAAAATPAGAATVREFPLGPGVTTPRDLVAGPGGALWATVDGGLARIRPTGEVTRITAGLSPGAQPYAIAGGTGGGLWFTENDEETGDGNGVLGQVSSAGAVRELQGDGLDQPASLRDVVGRSDGTAAYVGNADGGLGIYSEDDGEGTYDSTPIDTDGNTNPTSAALGPDGRVWYTGTDSPAVIGVAAFGPRRLSYPATYREYAIPAGAGAFDDGEPDDIVAGPDNAMWFTLPAVGAVGRIDVLTGAVTTFPVSATSVPTGLTRGPDGAVWFTDAGAVPGIGRIDPVTEAIVVRTDGISSPLAAPRRITTGPDGALWFTEPGIHAVGRVDPAEFVAGPQPEPEPEPEPQPQPQPEPQPQPQPEPPPQPQPPVEVVPPAPPAVPVPTPPAPAPPVVAPPAAVRFVSVSRGIEVRYPRRVRLRFRLSRAATVGVTVGGAQTRAAGARGVPRMTVRARAGWNRLVLPRLRPGRHVVALRATTADGTTAVVRRTVLVRAARVAAPAFAG